DERGVDAEAPQRDVEEGAGAAVEPGAGHEVVAGAGQAREREELGRLPARGGDGAEPALEAGHARLEGGDGGVGDAAVDVPVLLEGEERGGFGGVFEDETRRLVDGHGARPGGWIGRPSGVDGASSKAVLLLHGVETRGVKRVVVAVAALQVAL